MKKKLLLICIASCMFTAILSGQNVYYVAADGNDDNPGTFNEPWATWQKAFNTVDAGDTVYFRSSIWYPTSSITLNPTRHIGHNGTYGNPICFFNYPGETPIADFINLPESVNAMSGLDLVTITHVKLRGLTVRNVRQTTPGQWIAGIDISRNVSEENNGVITLERMVSYGNGGTGIMVQGFDTLYLVNCDSYNNIDSTTTGTIQGGRADGYNITSGGTAADTFRIAYITGCRAWYNSDDGFDISATKQFQVCNCWSWLNGRLQGDGTGFKFAYSHVRIPSKRRVCNTITAYNTHDAYGTMNLVDPLNGPVTEFLNNTSYRNEVGFFSAVDNYDCDNGCGLDIFKNNLVYNSTSSYFDQTKLLACNFNYPTYTVQDHNTWIPALENPFWSYNNAVTVNDADFISLDSSQLYRSRKSDGSLPDIDFLRLMQGSDLIDAGIDVGLPYYGNAPDIGAFEFNPSTEAEDDKRCVKEFQLYQNYPNPFNATTVISYKLIVNSKTVLRIYDILGREIAVLVNEIKSAETYTVKWDASGFPSGVYFYRLSANGYSETKKLVLMK